MVCYTLHEHLLLFPLGGYLHPILHPQALDKAKSFLQGQEYSSSLSICIFQAPGHTDWFRNGYVHPIRTHPGTFAGTYGKKVL